MWVMGVTSEWQCTGRESMSPFPYKGSTINDLEGGGGKIENGFIFSAETPFENLIFIFSWRRACEFFFSRFPPSPPKDH